MDLIAIIIAILSGAFGIIALFISALTGDWDDKVPMARVGVISIALAIGIGLLLYWWVYEVKPSSIILYKTSHHEELVSSNETTKVYATIPSCEVEIEKIYPLFILDYDIKYTFKAISCDNLTQDQRELVKTMERSYLGE